MTACFSAEDQAVNVYVMLFCCFR